MTRDHVNRLCLVVPCFNETHRLNAPAFLRGLEAMPFLELCFVDDGSTDGTKETLRMIVSASAGRAHLIAFESNCGKAEAVRVGLAYAASRAPFCGFWDCDLSAPLSEVPALLQILKARPEIQWVLGIRLLALGRQIERSKLRHYVGRVFATLSSFFLALPAYDTQCGAKLFRSSRLLEGVIARPFSSRWIFDVELLSRAAAQLRKEGPTRLVDVVYEQPLNIWIHQQGSKVGLIDYVRAFRDLVRIWANQPVR